jgi:chemotaxis protein MotA
MFVIIGWVVALGCIFGVYIVHGGNIGVILQALPFEMITIFGGGHRRLPGQQPDEGRQGHACGPGPLLQGQQVQQGRYMELLALLYDILQKVRKEGLMSIEKDVETRTARPCSRNTRTWATTTM